MRFSGAGLPPPKGGVTLPAPARPGSPLPYPSCSLTPYPLTLPCVSPSMNLRCSTMKKSITGAIIITAEALVSAQSRPKRLANAK